MRQLDMFDETLEKKIYRMEKWIGRLQKEMWFLKQIYELRKRGHQLTSTPTATQTDMFGT